jgi:hypothetical protein
MAQIVSVHSQNVSGTNYKILYQVPRGEQYLVTLYH